jgi:DNA-binding transcriptional LysR family regulator
MPDSAFVSRRIARAPRLAVAAPAYLAAHGAPATPGDLAAHACIVGPGSSAAEGWVFQRGNGAAVSVAPKARIQVSAAEGVTACARAGLGIAIAALWMCRRELEAGEVVPVLTSFTLAPVEAYAVVTAGRRMPAKTRAFVEHLAAALRDEPVTAPARAPRKS